MFEPLTLGYLTAAVLLVGLVAVFLVSAYTLHKTRRMHVMLYEIRANEGRERDEALFKQYRQLEALHALHLEFGFDKALPATRGWAASPDFLLVIARAVQEWRPKVIVECGSGGSTVVLAHCARRNGDGHVYSLDHDPAFAAATRRELERHGLQDFATVIDAPLTEHRIGDRDWPWYAVEALPGDPIDMLIVDGPPLPVGSLARYPAGPLLFSRLAKQAVVYLDDAGRPEETKIVARWQQEFDIRQSTSHATEKGCVALWLEGS